MDVRQMIEKFQCLGCGEGGDTQCGSYKHGDIPGGGCTCEGHVIGTRMMGIGYFALGLPHGFNRPGYVPYGEHLFRMFIRSWPEGTKPEWNELNVAVWAMEMEGFLYVRTYIPRNNLNAVDVIEKGTLALCPNAIDVSKFYNEID